MSVKYVQGNILDLIDTGEFNYVLHGCNCFHTMGAGVAKVLANKYPEVVTADRATVIGDPNKLGSFTVAKINNALSIVNLYTQYSYGRYKQHFSYQAYANALRSLCIKVLMPRDKILMPKIGVGLGGGDWDKIKGITASVMQGQNVTVCYL